MPFYNYYPYLNQYMSQMQIPQMVQQQMQQPVIQQQPQQYPIAQGGFVRVPNENEARIYPVAPVTSVTFIDEYAPYCYTKTVDRSQLDRPKFEKYRLVKEEDAPASQNDQEQASQPLGVDLDGYMTKAEFDAFKDEIEDSLSDIKGLQSDLKNLRDRVEILSEKKTPVRKEPAKKE